EARERIVRRLVQELALERGALFDAAAQGGEALGEDSIRVGELRGALAHALLEVVVRGAELLGEPAIFSDDLRMRERARHGADEQREVPALRHEVEHALVNGGQYRVEVVVSGHDDDRDLRLDLREASLDLDAAHLGHAEVADDDLGPPGPGPAEGLGSAP